MAFQGFQKKSFTLIWAVKGFGQVDRSTLEVITVEFRWERTGFLEWAAEDFKRGLLK